MESVKRRRVSSGLMVGSGFLMNWIFFGPAFAGAVSLGVVLFAGVPFRLASVYGKPHSQHPR